MADENNKFGAVGPMLGYLYQCRQALFVAIQLSKNFPGLSISIERFDDIALEDVDVPVLQLQLKHHIKAGTLTDSSPDIWRTLRIWSEQIKANPQLPFETRFAILTTGTAVDGSAAALLRPGRSNKDEETALKLLDALSTTSKNQETETARAAFSALV